MTSRTIALEILCQWHGSGKPIDIFLNELSSPKSKNREKGLVKTIVMGILRQKEYLDQVIKQFAHHPLKRMRPRTIYALRMGFYQLLFMDRIPPSAAINETVKAFKSKKQPTWLVRVVNGILRNGSRNIEKIKRDYPEISQQITNHPDWLVKRWQDKYGLELSRKICLTNNTHPPLTLRVNRSLIEPDEFLLLLQNSNREAERGVFSPESIIIKNYRGSITDLPGYDKGFFQVQDEAAQLASYLMLPLQSSSQYLDACCGLGGKMTHLLTLCKARATITGIEPDSRRYKLLLENLHRLQLSAPTMQTTLESFAPACRNKFAGILIDAPCSGTGVIRRHPDIRWNRHENEIATYQKKQLSLLKAAGKLTREQGIIVYATCSLEREENEEVVARFIEQQPEFQMEDTADFLPDQARVLSKNGFFCPTPANGLDGFFAVRLKKTK